MYKNKNIITLILLSAVLSLFSAVYSAPSPTLAPKDPAVVQYERKAELKDLKEAVKANEQSAKKADKEFEKAKANLLNAIDTVIADTTNIDATSITALKAVKAEVEKALKHADMADAAKIVDPIANVTLIGGKVDATKTALDLAYKRCLEKLDARDLAEKAVSDTAAQIKALKLQIESNKALFRDIKFLYFGKFKVTWFIIVKVFAILAAIILIGTGLWYYIASTNLSDLKDKVSDVKDTKKLLISLTSAFGELTKSLTKVSKDKVNAEISKIRESIEAADAIGQQINASTITAQKRNSRILKIVPASLLGVAAFLSILYPLVF